MKQQTNNDLKSKVSVEKEFENGTDFFQRKNSNLKCDLIEDAEFIKYVEKGCTKKITNAAGCNKRFFSFLALTVFVIQFRNTLILKLLSGQNCAKKISFTKTTKIHFSQKTLKVL